MDIPLSVYDILRSIKLAENHNCKYAVIGFPAITRNATFLCEVLRYNVDIYTIHDQKEARTICRGWKILVARWCCATLSLTHWHRNTAFLPCSSPPVSRVWRMR